MSSGDNSTGTVRIIACLLVVACVSSFGFGLFAYAAGAWAWYRGVQTESWPAVEGIINGSKIVEITRHDPDTGSDTNFKVAVSYSYDVNDVRYQGDTIQFGAMTHDRRSGAEQELKKYSTGQTVQVFHDPADPENAVLIRGVGSGTWVLFVAGTMSLVVGAVFRICDSTDSPLANATVEVGAPHPGFGGEPKL